MYKHEPAAVILCLGHGLSIADIQGLEGPASCLLLMVSGLPSPKGLGCRGADSPGCGDEVW